MQDQETGSYWSHITGEALMGKLKGRWLSTLPVAQTTWSKWKKSHPHTKVLKKDKEIRSSHYQRYFEDPARTGMFRTEWLMERMPGKKLIQGITIGPHALAVDDGKLKAGEFLQRGLGDDDVLMIRASDGGVHAFLSRVGDKRLTFRKESKEWRYVDLETKSVWDLEQGICQKGELKGKKLKELAVTPAFWFAWSTFYPNTQVVD